MTNKIEEFRAEINITARLRSSAGDADFSAEMLFLSGSYRKCPESGINSSARKTKDGDNMNLYGQMFFKFTKIGTFTIGGGYAMLPLIQREVVEREKWVGAKEFLDMVAISQSMPGIFTVNLSVFVGYKLKKNLGGIVAALGVILPSFLIILLIAAFFRHFNENVYVAKAFRAVRPAVVALIAVPVFNAAKEARINLKTVIIPAASAFLIWFCGISPIYVVLAAVAGGLCVMRFKKRRK